MKILLETVVMLIMAYLVFNYPSDNDDDED